jgi:probable rRNA maturation factor
LPIVIQTEGTADKHPQLNPLRQLLRNKAKKHLKALKLTGDPEISVVLCDDATIHQLNLQWREEDTPTDVLSFPLLEDDEDPATAFALGDIVISVEYAERLVATDTHRARVAAELGVPLDALTWTLAEEIEFLFIHGLLHLIGHDHLEPEEEAEMKAEEVRLWRASRPAAKA